ncbi:MAG: HD domain-containing protein [Thermodesulfobacteriota bacterium]
MYKDWYEVFPEITWITDDSLREQTASVYEDACQPSHWTLEDMDIIPFTLLISNTVISYRTHVRAVTNMAHAVYQEYQRHYYDSYSLDYNVLVAGGLLHDVGKLVEYERDANGTIVKSDLGKKLRHPFLGTGLAMQRGVPYGVAHIIAYHSKEGDGTLRTPEAVIINKLDMMNFETIKSHLGMI